MKLLLFVCCLISCSLFVTANIDSNGTSDSNFSPNESLDEYFRVRGIVDTPSSSSEESNNSSSSSEENIGSTLNYRSTSRSISSNSTRYTREIVDWVYIESKRHPNYMLYMSAPGNVYIYPKDNYVGGWNQKWTVETDITGTPHYKKFVNRQNYNALYADDNGHAYGDTSKSESNQYWEMIPVDNGQYYYLRNRHNGRILDSGELQNCASSSTCCCGTAHAYDVYTGTDFQKWKVY